jgi:ABC-type glycerol-3-phosphate transport system substrate-binding protein
MFAARTAIAALFGVGFSAAAAAQEPVTIQFWEGHSVQEETATIEMIKAFEASHPNIKINRTKVSFGTNFEKITTAVASNTLPDVSPIWSGFLTQFAAAGQLLDLTEYGAAETKAKIYPAAWSYVEWQGGVYGVPYAFDPRFIAYNETAFKEAGLSEPPKTYDELLAYAEKLTKRNGNTVERYGMGIGAADALVYLYVNLVYSFGGTIFNEDGTEVVLNNQAGVEGANYLSKLAKSGTISYGAAGGTDDLRNSLLSGRVAMLHDGPWIFYAASNASDPQPIGAAPMPVVSPEQESVNFGSVGAYVVYKSSKHPKEAAEFVKFMASPEAQQYRVKLLKTGVATDVASQPAAIETFKKWPGLEKAQTYLAQSQIFPRHEKWSKVFQAILPAAEAIMGGADPQATLDDMVNQINRQLRRG